MQKNDLYDFMFYHFFLRFKLLHLFKNHFAFTPLSFFKNSINFNFFKFDEYFIVRYCFYYLYLEYLEQYHQKISFDYYLKDFHFKY